MVEQRHRTSEAGICRRERTYLHLNIENDDFPLLRLLLDGSLACAVSVASKLGVLNEAILGDQVLERLHGYEVVVRAIFLASAGLARRVRDREGEAVRVRIEELAVEGSLAHARGSGDDEWSAVGRRCWAERQFWNLELG
jgi:hypothetical protein